MDHPRRWIVAGGLLLAAAVIAVQFWSGSPKDEQVAMAAVPAVTPLPPTGPQRASDPDVATAEKTEKTEKVASAAKPASAAASGATAKALEFKPPTTEDFGQLALVAMHGGTPKQAGEAAYLLQLCLRASLYDFPGHARSSSPQDAKRNRKIAAAEWLEDRCRSITPEMQAQRGALAARAIEAGGPDAGYVALIYGRSVGYRPPAAMRQPLLDAMNSAFRAGDEEIVREFAFNGERLGLSKAEARAYFLVSMAEAREENKPLHEAILREGPFRDMPDAEVRESETIAERLKQERKSPTGRNG